MNSEKPMTWSRIRAWVERHPAAFWLLNLLGSIASLVCLYIALYPRNPQSRLTYSVQPVRTTIVKKSRASDLSVTYQGMSITDDITAAQVAIENTGWQPIRTDDIITKPEIVVSNSRILGVGISVPALEGTDFHLLTNQMASGRVQLDWRILEKGDKPVVEVIYAGDTEVPIGIQGRIVGQTQPKRVSWPAVDKGVTSLPALRTVLFIAGSLIGLVVLVVVISSIVVRIRKSLYHSPPTA
ncbi:MAG: hypothetical protein ABSF95_14495 [Verrucomicrobiota bacterium]|jgi:hypothetical protein